MATPTSSPQLLYWQQLLNTLKGQKSSDGADPPSYLEKTAALNQLWRQFPSDTPNDPGPTLILDLCQASLVHVIHPDWLDSTSTETRNQILTAIKAVTPQLNTGTKAKLDHLCVILANPWAFEVLRNLLTAHEKANFAEYLRLESIEVSRERVAILCKGACWELASNLGRFLVLHNIAQTSKDELWDQEVLKDVQNVAQCLVRIKRYSTLEKLVNRFSPPQYEYVLKFMEQSLTESSEMSHCLGLMLNFGLRKVVMGQFPAEISKPIFAIAFKHKVSPKHFDYMEMIQYATYPSAYYCVAQGLMGVEGDDSHKRNILSILIRGITLHLNRLEVHRIKKGKEEIAKIEKELALVYLDLSNVLGDYPKLAREATLTAFSLEPSADNFAKVQNCPRNPPMKPELPPKIVEDSGEPKPKLMKFDPEAFAPDDLIKDLEAKVQLEPKVPSNGDDNNIGLLCIEGHSLTSRWNYNPETHPMKAFQVPLFEGHSTLLSDLLIVLNAPRWHLLSWLHDWELLESRCRALMADIKVKATPEELEYLVIDYTQFDEWSSDEETEINTGIEEGYEKWADSDDDDNNGRSVEKVRK